MTHDPRLTFSTFPSANSNSQAWYVAQHVWVVRTRRPSTRRPFGMDEKEKAKLADSSQHQCIEHIVRSFVRSSSCRYISSSYVRQTSKQGNKVPIMIREMRHGPGRDPETRTRIRIRAGDRDGSWGGI